MAHHFPGGRRLGLPLLLFLLIGALRLPAQEEAASPYAGSETCQTCHEDIHASFQKNAHAFLEKEKGRGWAGRTCESCHGPGAKHSESLEAADIRNPAKLAPLEADKSCLQCHLNQPTNAGRIRGGHARNLVACISCHPVHGSEKVSLQPHPNSKINAQCAECHAGAWASFQRPHAHRLSQGAMSCVDCHNPHGSSLPRNMRVALSNEPGCLRCHGDKRGPFAFEHPPVRLEGCQSCHEPHGSANPRMLVRHEVSQLCLECHANLPAVTGGTQSGALGGIPPALHDLRSPRFRNCTICHVKIHGSQVNRDFMR
jgi:DmsE family decaheme c-type cytochrome